MTRPRPHNRGTKWGRLGTLPNAAREGEIRVPPLPSLSSQGLGATCRRSAGQHLPKTVFPPQSQAVRTLAR